jgi:GWxTD domain-containing protein
MKNRRKNDKKGKGLALAVIIVLMFVTVNHNIANSRSTKMSPEHQEFYNYAQYFFTKNERKIFRHLTTDEARERFINNFWEIRDPNPYTDVNEFKLEIEGRYEYVCKYLKEGPIPGWKTDRGRIYILLGPPSEWAEDHYNRGNVLQWYYNEYNVYIRFYDLRGTGIYQMDLTTVSLALLDVLDNKRYFIVNKEGKLNWQILDFEFSYLPKAKEVRIEIDAKKLNFETDPEDSDTMIAKIKVNLVVYPTDKTDDFKTYSQIKAVKVKKEKLLEKKATISASFPFELPQGKMEIDANVSDVFGDAVYRKFIKINNKQG